MGVSAPSLHRESTDSLIGRLSDIHVPWCVGRSKALQVV